MNPMEIIAPIFNIQTYCIHDGPGIRVTVFVKGCPLNCLWCSNPESNKAMPQLMTYPGKCSGCGACVDACPQKAISLAIKDGRCIAITQRSLCTDCGSCTVYCQSKAREIAGKEMTVHEVLQVILQDKLFMDASGGGMTISGGEALYHPDFTSALLEACKSAGVHTAIETSVFASREVIDRVFRYVDIGLLDIKHMDSLMHEKLTGVPNERILENIKHIYHDLKVPIIIRVPVITCKNDDMANMKALGDFTANVLGKDVPVNLLPYHRLGVSKYESLGLPYEDSIQLPEKEQMEEFKTLLESYGLLVQVGG